MNSEKRENLFLDLVPVAKRVLHQSMIGGGKQAVTTAQDILDRAGETKRNETSAPVQIVITNSQVAMLAKVADEVEARLEGDNLYVPPSKEDE